ncbi:MAG: spike base protein, RCAP_Rcc01079 family [Devosia sp.]
MVENYEGRAGNLAASARRGFAITANDGADLAAETRAIYVGSSGNLSVVLVSGDQVGFAAVPAGTVLPVRAIRVRSTGTTASQLVGLY